LKHHPNHPAYAGYIKEQRVKKQKLDEKFSKKHTFNSPPTTKNKENINN
jgi:hypothetical protein